MPPADSGAMVFSLSEVQATCLKAARGCGMPWGLAEETGMAAAWLSAAGLPGPESVLAFLRGPDAGRPQIGPDVWSPPMGSVMSPILAGAALVDFGAALRWPLQLAQVGHPLLLLPFTARAASGLKICLQISWPGASAILAPDMFEIARPDGLTAPRGDIVVESAPARAGMQAPGRLGRRVALEVWQALDDLALRTTVPATTRSHADAGAGGSDND